MVPIVHESLKKKKTTEQNRLYIYYNGVSLAGRHSLLVLVVSLVSWDRTRKLWLFVGAVDGIMFVDTAQNLPKITAVVTAWSRWLVIT